MLEPRCFLCGRQSRRFLVKFEVQDCYICRVCENAVHCKKSFVAFPAKPDYEFTLQDFSRMAHHRKSKMMIYSNEELTQRYEDEILAAEEAFG